jgi:hypothetical protein
VPDTEYWNVIASQVGDAEDAVALDKSQEWIHDRVLLPRSQGRPLVIGGRTLTWDSIERVRITVTTEPSSTSIEHIKAHDRESGVFAFGGPSYAWRAAARARDVTDDLIDGPPGSSVPIEAAVTADLVPPDPRRVMVVYGRDGQARRAMFDFLRALGLDPGEWRRLVNETDKAAPYVGEVLEIAFARASAVVVLLTPDNEARLRDEHHGGDEPEHERELTPQARPNVLFEAGMAFGAHPDRTILVEIGKLRQFSDIAGRHAVRLDGTAAPLIDIVGRLKRAGCAVDEGGDDWADPDRFPRR